MDQLTIEIGKVVFSIKGLEQYFFTKHLIESYGNFCTVKKKNPHVSIHLYYGKIPNIILQPKDLTFDSGSIWCSYKLKKKKIFKLNFCTPNAPPKTQLAIFDSDFRRGKIYSDSPFLHPLPYQLSSWLMINLLSLVGGIIVHACGIIEKDEGYLFMGGSQQGKSTLAKLFFTHGSTILNDDRIIICQIGKYFWIFGTPWNGTFNISSSRGAILKKIFFIQHSPKNTLFLEQKPTAFSKILKRSFLPFWDKKGMEFCLGFCRELAEERPCYQLGFIPDKKVIDLIISS